jgi:hypothetical protein
MRSPAHVRLELINNPNFLNIFSFAISEQPIVDFFVIQTAMRGYFVLENEYFKSYILH